jgi:hypothetical protein
VTEEKTYRVRITRGVLVKGKAYHPDAKGTGPIVELEERDARAVVGAQRGVYVDPDQAAGGLTKETAGATVRRR